MFNTSCHIIFSWKLNTAKNFTLRKWDRSNSLYKDLNVVAMNIVNRNSHFSVHWHIKAEWRIYLSLLMLVPHVFVHTSLYGPILGLCQLDPWEHNLVKFEPNTGISIFPNSWWRHQMEVFPCYWPFVRCHQMETISVSLALCAVNSPKKPVTRSFDVFFDLCLNKSWVNNREAGELRRNRAHHDVTVMFCYHFSKLKCRRYLKPFLMLMAWGGRFKNTYELLNQRALKFSYVNKIHIFQCMGKVSFEITHKISYPYIERYDFNAILKF